MLDCPYPIVHDLRMCCGQGTARCDLEWYEPCGLQGGCWDRSTCAGCAEPVWPGPRDVRWSLAQYPAMESISWDDACWEMIMECDQPDDSDDGVLPPSAALVAKYCRWYPQWADDFVDFAATCRTVDFWAKKYPAPEPTEAELKAIVARTMKIVRRITRKMKARTP